jgi:hypothetical protein
MVHRAARRINSSGTVYARTITLKQFNRLVGAQKRATPDHKDDPRQPADPQLPAHTVDAVLLLKTYPSSYPLVLPDGLKNF